MYEEWRPETGFLSGYGNRIFHSFFYHLRTRVRDFVFLTGVMQVLLKSKPFGCYVCYAGLDPSKPIHFLWQQFKTKYILSSPWKYPILIIMSIYKHCSCRWSNEADRSSASVVTSLYDMTPAFYFIWSKKVFLGLPVPLSFYLFLYDGFHWFVKS